MSGLHINNLSHRYDRLEVISGVSVFVAPGELVCLLGPSGCGKTTLLRVAAGLEPLQKGQVHIGERVVADGGNGFHLAPEDRGVGLMFQDYALFPHLTVSENISFGLDQPSPDERRWIEHAVDQMGMTEYARSYPHTLSGGQQQRVALLRAMAPNPRVLLLDEPFSGLDVTRRARVREQTLALLKESGVATLMVTHDPDEAMFMADRILVMNEGRIVQDGTPVETYFEPENAFVAALFGPVNRLGGTVEDGRVETPFGRLAADGFEDGDAVEVLIRPEGLRLAQDGSTPPHQAGDAPCSPANRADAPLAQNGVECRVLSARPLGRASHVVIAAPAPEGTELRMEARIPGVFLPESGSLVTVSVNRREAHVFAAS